MRGLVWTLVIFTDARPVRRWRPTALGQRAVVGWGCGGGLLGQRLYEPPKWLVERVFVGGGLDAPSPLASQGPLPLVEGQKNALAMALTYVAYPKNRETQNARAVGR